MEDIIEQLSHIENKAIQIIESAEQQKKEIALEMEQQTKKFDAQVADEIQAHLQKIQNKLNEQKDRELEKMEAANLEAQTLLKQNFEKNHTKWAAELLQQLIGA